MTNTNIIPPPPPPGWYPPTPPSPPSTLYMPNPSLIAALVASVAVVIGSSAPWVSVLVFSANGTIGDGGKFTLALGLVSAAVLLVAALGKMQAFGYILAVIAGVLAFAVGALAAINIMSKESIDLFGREIGAEIGWGLWMVLIASVALIVTASVAYNQTEKAAK